jgi:hypothetical protein
MSQNGGQSSGNHNNFQKNMSNGAYCTYCTYCCRPGHIKGNCYTLKNKSTVTVVQVTMAIKEKV